MKKLFTLLAVAAAMTFTAQAETLTFQMGANDGAVILNNGKFNPLGSFIGNTSGDEGNETVIQVAQVDFAAGDIYKAVSLRFANGWGGGGTAILKAGADFESAETFATIDLINWNDSYTNFRSIGANFTAAPSGLQYVYLTFQGRAGNVQDVRLYSDEFTPDMFESGSGSMLKEPCNIDGYDQMATVLDINGSELIYSDNAETRIDNGSWGWTGEGVVVRYGTLDFGDGDYKQVVLELASHWQGDQSDHCVEVYLDDYENGEPIANVWCGIDVKAKLYLARNIEAITGEHTVFLKWHGGSCNIANVHFVKDYLYSLGNICDPVLNEKENNEPSEGAVRYSFLNAAKTWDDVVYIGRDSGRTTILNKGQWEDDNVGWTGGGTVLKVTGIDFGDGHFNEMLVSHATGGSWLGYIDEANFKFYIDLEATAEPAPLPRRVNDWGNAAAELEGVDPIATVWMQATGGWGNVYTTKGELAEVQGVHDLYIVYTASDGANVKDLYLDGMREPEITTAVQTVKVANTINGNVYSIDGRLVKKGTSTEGLQPGLYIIGNQKVLVK